MKKKIALRTSFFVIATPISIAMIIGPLTLLANSPFPKMLNNISKLILELYIQVFSLPFQIMEQILKAFH